VQEVFAAITLNGHKRGAGIYSDMHKNILSLIDVTGI
jgi:hypothetical protein